MRRLLSGSPLGRARRALLGGLGLALFQTLFVDIAVLTVPIYDMQLFDRVLLSRNMSTVAMLSVICVAGLIVYAALDYLRSATLVAMAGQVGAILRVPVLEAGLGASLGGTSAAGVEAMRDLSELRSFLASGAVSLPLDAVCSPLLFTVMFLLHPAFGWLAVAGTSSLVMIGIVTDVLVRPAVAAAARERAEAGNRLAAGLRDPEQTDGLGMMPALARRWAERHAAALAGMRHAAHLSDNVGMVAKLVRFTLQAGVVALGAVLILSAQASPGALMGANLLMGKVMGPFDALVSTWRRWIAAEQGWSRIVTLLEGSGAARAAGAAPAREGLLLQDVRVAAPSGRVLLDGIDLALPPGTIAVVAGPNGAGKSTLLRTLVGLMRPSSGGIWLDGAPAGTGVDTGYLPQGVQLLDGTVRDNIGRFTEAASEDVIAAATAATVHEIVGRLRQGYGTVIGAAANSLSGGQKQRIGLARAVFGMPRLIVLDEPDASLDAPGQAALLAAMQAARAAGGIVVVASHRPQVLAAADVVITLRDGRLASVEWAGQAGRAPAPLLALA